MGAEIKNGGKLLAWRGSQEEGKQSVQPQESANLGSLEWGNAIKKGHPPPKKKVCYNTRDEAGMLYLFPWPAKMVCSQGMPAGAGGWDNEMSWGKKSWKRRSLWSPKDRVKVESPLLFFCRAEEETEEIKIWGTERKVNISSQLTCFPGRVGLCVKRDACWNWGLG